MKSELKVGECDCCQAKNVEVIVTHVSLCLTCIQTLDDSHDYEGSEEMYDY